MWKLIVATLALVAVACGPDTQMMAVKTAHYKGDKAAMFAAIQQAVADKHKVHEADPATLTVKTEIHWFSQEGESLMADVDSGDITAAFVAGTSPAQAFERENAVVAVDPLDADGVTTDLVYSLYPRLFLGMFGWRLHRDRRVRGHL